MNEHKRVVTSRRRIRFSHLLIGLLLVGIAAFAIFRVNTKSKLRARIDAIRAAGYPVTCAELDQWYSIPADAENAAYTMEEALFFLKEWDDERERSLPLVGRAELPARTEPFPEDMKNLIAEYVADNNEALELLHEAGKIEHCRYPIDLSAGLATRLPELSKMRKCAFLLQLEAILHANDGNVTAALNSITSVFGVARSLDGQPVTISQLVGAACQNIAVQAIEQVVNRTELTDEQLAKLVDCVGESERISDMSQAFVGERCMGISSFSAPETIARSGNDAGAFAKSILAIYKAVGLGDADQVRYLDFMDDYIRSAQIAAQERLKAAKAVDARVRSISKGRILLHEITPALTRIITLELRAIAHLRCARAALAVERYRLAAGRLPEGLADLVPSYLETVPIDPFDGNDLRYKRLQSGFVIYSIGEDLSDDGGRERPTRRKRGEDPPKWDVTFIVER